MKQLEWTHGIWDEAIGAGDIRYQIDCEDTLSISHNDRTILSIPNSNEKKAQLFDDEIQDIIKDAIEDSYMSGYRDGEMGA